MVNYPSTYTLGKDITLSLDGDILTADITTNSLSNDEGKRLLNNTIIKLQKVIPYAILEWSAIRPRLQYIWIKEKAAKNPITSLFSNSLDKDENCSNALIHVRINSIRHVLHAHTMDKRGDLNYLQISKAHLKRTCQFIQDKGLDALFEKYQSEENSIPPIIDDAKVIGENEPADSSPGTSSSAKKIWGVVKSIFEALGSFFHKFFGKTNKDNSNSEEKIEEYSSDTFVVHC